MRPERLPIAVLARGIHTKTAVLTASLRQKWSVKFLLSGAQASTLVRSGEIAVLLYDGDLEGNWRDACRACVQAGVAFGGERGQRRAFSGGGGGGRLRFIGEAPEAGATCIFHRLRARADRGLLAARLLHT